MKNPIFTLKLVLVLLAGFSAGAVTAIAQPAGTGPNKNARARPQVIYHLPSASHYGATLHSQAKGQNNELPIDGDMPTSLQNSRANANAAAQQAETPAPTLTPSLQEHSVKPRLKANRSHSRPRSFARPPGPGNSHGNKSHKK